MDSLNKGIGLQLNPDNDEYGLDGIFVGVPAIIGKNGIEKVIEIKLNDEEKTMFDNSVEAVRQLNSIASKME